MAQQTILEPNEGLDFTGAEGNTLNIAANGDGNILLTAYTPAPNEPSMMACFPAVAVPAIFSDAITQTGLHPKALWDKAQSNGYIKEQTAVPTRQIARAKQRKTNTRALSHQPNPTPIPAGLKHTDDDGVRLSFYPAPGAVRIVMADGERSIEVLLADIDLIPLFLHASHQTGMGSQTLRKEAQKAGTVRTVAPPANRHQRRHSRPARGVPGTNKAPGASFGISTSNRALSQMERERMESTARERAALLVKKLNLPENM